MTPNPLLVQVEETDHLPTMEEFIYLGSAVQHDEEQTVALSTVSGRPETPVVCWTMCGAPHNTAPTLTWDWSRPVSFSIYFTPLNFGKWQWTTLSNFHQPSTQTTSGEFCKSSDLKASLSNNNSPSANKKVWEGNGDGLDMLLGGNKMTLPGLSSSRHQRVNEREEDPRTPASNSESRTEGPGLNQTWGSIQKLAQSRQKWWTFVSGLRVTGLNWYHCFIILIKMD